MRNPQPPDGADTIRALKQRLADDGRQFENIVKDVRDKGNWDDGFVDALCDPPEAFTYGGMLLHVATFSAYRLDAGHPRVP